MRITAIAAAALYALFAIVCCGPIFVEADETAAENLADCRAYADIKSRCITWYPVGTALAKTALWPAWVSYRLAKKGGG